VEGGGGVFGHHRQGGGIRYVKIISQTKNGKLGGGEEFSCLTKGMEDTDIGQWSSVKKGGR